MLAPFVVVVKRLLSWPCCCLFIAVMILATLTITGQSVRDVFDNVGCALSSGSCAPTAGTGGSGGGGATPPAAPTPTVSTGASGGSKDGKDGKGGPPPHAGVCPVHNPHCTP